MFCGFIDLEGSVRRNCGAEGMAGLVAFQNKSTFRYLETSAEIIRLAVMMYVQFPLSLRQDENLLHERGVDIFLETVCAWWNLFGPCL